MRYGVTFHHEYTWWWWQTAFGSDKSGEKAGVPCQRFVNHSDVAGGSTLGNILASSLPVKGVDMGNPLLAMHSCRETAAVADHLYCIKAFTTFYEE